VDDGGKLGYTAGGGCGRGLVSHPKISKFGM
jgi:hypothetical protein